MTLFADLKDLTRVEKGVALIFGQGTIHTKAVKFASWPNNVGFSYTQAECVTRNLKRFYGSSTRRFSLSSHILSSDSAFFL